ncbi:hypothetical protein GALMADRAFT_817903 [Galerina marginata CBS 339.88]|uniref:EF-hand domain-containing protein n=1 Tax=Galerina marginata (strain CBS 339.88) TaxID=685588 RepID=A0A067TR12_GALM3|nr:hypothetical protein GALMADRAFT_817903 [Galerina marginata CBS 339.88]
MEQQGFSPQNLALFNNNTPLSGHPQYHNRITSSLTLEKDQEQQWQDLTKYYEENKLIIERSLPVDEKTTDLLHSLDSWVETASVVLEGLVALGNVHPILGVAIFTFHSVISLDLSRRKNDRKVLAVYLQMQNMMSAMFQLRKIKHIHVQERERESDRAQLQSLIKAIAEDIRECGCILTHYQGRKTISKLVNASKYERRFADHIQKFSLRRSELQSLLSAFTAAGIDAANVAIVEVGQKLDSVDHKLETVMGLFRKLDTPREQDVVKFLKDHGGAEECVSKDDLLIGLLAKAGQSPEARKAGGSEKEAFISLRKELDAELKENLDEVLASSLSRFEKLLIVQSNNVEHQGHLLQEHNMKLDKLISTSILILEEGKLTKKAVLSDTTVKLKDPELQEIWDRMGLKRSVKAKHFVLTLRDHLLTDRSLPGTAFPYQLLTPPAEEPEPVLPSSRPTLRLELTSSQKKFESDSDEWIFDFIDVTHVQPVVEAMDEDGSGFISVKEANKFALSRPKGVSLLHWFAYWAAGWHVNIMNYRTKLYSIMLEMHHAFSSVHLANQAFVGCYLNDLNFLRIEGLLRSTKPLPHNARKERKICDIAASVAASMEHRLLTNLKEMSFVVDSASDVTLIAGSRRVETWILPLLFLVLTQHLKIIKLARTRILHANELLVHSGALANIFSVFDARMRKLEAIFNQTHRDVESQFANHAYGMFLTSFKGTAALPALNTLLKAGGDDHPWPDSVANPKEPLSVSILVNGLGPTFQYEEPDLNPAAAPLEHTPHPIEGGWIGVCTLGDVSEIAHLGAFQFIIGPVVDKAIGGKGINFLGSVSVDGAVGTANEDGVINVSLVIVYPQRGVLVCQGQFDSRKNTIEGTWSEDVAVECRQKCSEVDGDVDEEKPSTQGHFYITKVSPDIFRFRYLLDGPSPDPSWSIARRRWAFATEAVLFQTQRRLGSWNFFHARISDRRKWIELRSRGKLNHYLDTGRGFLTDNHDGEFSLLRRSIPPSIARLYEGLATYLHDRQVYFLGSASCDVCHQPVAFTHLLCITCIGEDMTNHIDLCPECIESQEFNTTKNFVHQFSHSLIQASHLIPYPELPILIPRARLLSERIKNSVKASEDRKNSTRDCDNKALKGMKDADFENLLTSRPSIIALTCACCGKDVTLPCWACIACVLDTLICLDCERQGKRVQPREGSPGVHSREHYLLRINDSANTKASEVNGSRVETHLAKMERRINVGIDEGLLALEKKVNTQLEVVKKEVKDAVDDIAKNLKGVTPNLEAPPNDGLEVKLLPEGDHQIIVDPPGIPPRVLSSYESRLEQRLDMLEAKVDNQFGRLLAMMEAVVSASRRDSSKTEIADCTYCEV